MPQSRYHKARSEQVVAIRFRIEASAEEVIARLFEAIRGIELTLLKVVGDGHRVYPSEVGDPDRSASSWRAELFWHSPYPHVRVAAGVFPGTCRDLPRTTRSCMA